MKNKHFYRAIQKYGWDNFQHIILFNNLTAEQATTIERKLILDWNLLDCNYGYNLSGGGEGALSEETRKRMSEAQKGNTNGAGIIPSQETRKKISDSLKEYYKTHDNPQLGKHLTEEHKEFYVIESFQIKLAKRCGKIMPMYQVKIILAQELSYNYL